MDLSPYFKAVLEADTAPVVLCDLDHTILYMNPVAKVRYAAYGGEKLLGKNLLMCHPQTAQDRIISILEIFENDQNKGSEFEFHSITENKDVYMVALRDDNQNLIGYYEKHEYRTSEKEI